VSSEGSASRQRGRNAADEQSSKPAGTGATHGPAPAGPSDATQANPTVSPAGDTAAADDEAKKPAKAVRQPKPAKPPKQPRPPKAPRARRARLAAVRVDPWSVMKTSFMLSVACGIMVMACVLVVWNVLNASGVFDSINSTVADILGAASTTKFDVMDYVAFQKVAGFTALICVVDVVLITALATLGSFLYNLSASLLGGIEITLAEDD